METDLATAMGLVTATLLEKATGLATATPLEKDSGSVKVTFAATDSGRDGWKAMAAHSVSRLVLRSQQVKVAAERLNDRRRSCSSRKR